MVQRRTTVMQRVRVALKRPASVLLALLLGACSSANLSRFVVDSSIPTQQPQRQAVELPLAQQREHLRILAAYGGSYGDERLHFMLSSAVD